VCYPVCCAACLCSHDPRSISLYARVRSPELRLVNEPEPSRSVTGTKSHRTPSITLHVTAASVTLPQIRGAPNAPNAPNAEGVVDLVQRVYRVQA